MASSTSTVTRSKSLSCNQKCVVLESCGKGDIVFVIWNTRHCQFMVVQQSPNLYFVHGDSLQGLNLHLPPNQSTDEHANSTTITSSGSLSQSQISSTIIPMPFYALGRVVEKEYCQARKVIFIYFNIFFTFRNYNILIL